MDQIAFDGEGVTLIEETFGGMDTSELPIDYDDLEEYTLTLELVGEVQLDDFIAISENGNPTLDLSALEIGDVEVNESSVDETNASGRSEPEDDFTVMKRSQMPAIPERPSGKWTDSNETHYTRLVNSPESQPAVYRRLIRNEGKISKPAFERWAKRQGYKPKKGGSHNASLLMLERIGEIERMGHGDGKIIHWRGE